MAQTSRVIRGFQLRLDRAIEGMRLANGGCLYVADPQGLSGGPEYECTENAGQPLPSPRSFYFARWTQRRWRRSDASLASRMGLRDVWSFRRANVQTFSRVTIF